MNTGSVDIPDTVLISRVDKKRLTVFSDGAGRSRSPALCSRGAGSGHTGFASLPHALQQTSVHPAAVAGGAVPDALRRLDLSRSRDALARAPRGARRIEISRGTRLHHLVSFSAPAGRRHPVARAGRNRAN